MKTEEKIKNNLKTIEEWALSGISEKEMAGMLGISYSGFRAEKKKNLALLALLEKCAKERKDAEQAQIGRVERSLFERCMGYNMTVKKVHKVKRAKTDKDGNLVTDKTGKVILEDCLIEATEETHVPADVGAVKFFLLNKARKDWKNDPDANDIAKKRLANDTKRTKAQINAMSSVAGGRTIEDVLEEAEERDGL